jgi:hypothetical protein
VWYVVRSLFPCGGEICLVGCPVICLVQSPPLEAVVVFGYIGGPFLVSRTGCARERHAPCIEGPFLVSRTGHVRERQTTNWGGRGLGYMLFNVHFCDQPYYCKGVMGPGTQFCTLLEVWVLRVGMSTLGHKRLCTPRIGDSQVPKTLEHDNVR